jgi:formate hydrogenlyase subunit 3/multisubunit Na+/H+ antiporter MnhD subunit
MAIQANPLDSTGHRFVLLLAIFCLLISTGTALTPPIETTSIGAGLGQVVGDMLLALFSAGTACVGLVISANAMRVAKDKKKNGNKQTSFMVFVFLSNRSYYAGFISVYRRIKYAKQEKEPAMRAAERC